MRRLRLLAGLGIVIGLALGVGANLGGGPTWWEPPPGVTVATAGTPAPTETADSSEGSTTPDVLRSLYFGWLDAIFRDDPGALDAVAATEPFRGAGLAAMETLEFAAPPTPEGIDVVEWEILLETASCMGVWAVVDLSASLGPGAETRGVDVLWNDGDGWRFASSWTHRDDLWATDCTGRT